jgi:hypothetical protein
MPTITRSLVGISNPLNARSRSPGGSLEAHPEPVTVSVKRGFFKSIIIFSFINQYSIASSKAGAPHIRKKLK